MNNPCHDVNIIFGDSPFFMADTLDKRDTNQVVEQHKEQGTVGSAGGGHGGPAEAGATERGISLGHDVDFPQPTSTGRGDCGFLYFVLYANEHVDHQSFEKEAEVRNEVLVEAAAAPIEEEKEVFSSSVTVTHADGMGAVGHVIKPRGLLFIAVIQFVLKNDWSVETLDNGTRLSFL